MTSLNLFLSFYSASSNQILRSKIIFHVLITLLFIQRSVSIIYYIKYPQKRGGAGGGVIHEPAWGFGWTEQFCWEKLEEGHVQVPLPWKEGDVCKLSSLLWHAPDCTQFHYQKRNPKKIYI